MARTPFCWLIIVLLLSACGSDPVEIEADADLHLNIAGMHCDGCANRIEHEIKQVDGVAAAEVSFVSSAVGPAHIRYASERIAPATINAKLSEMGQYRITDAVPADDATEAATEETDAAAP